MSDIDYHKLFENGQLIAAEPTHKEFLDRFWQSYKGYPEEEIFLSKYRSYLEQFHPEALAPVAVPSPLPESSEPAPEVASAEAVVETVAETPAAEQAIQPEMTDEDVDAFIDSHDDIKVHHLAGAEKRRQAVLDYLASQQ